MSESITVFIEAELGPLIPRYLENRRRDLVQIQASLAALDFEDLARIGHGMKGSGGGYGLDFISDLGGRMECAARAGDAAAVHQQHAELSDYLDRLVVHFEDQA